jgi:hypothetical protein
VDRVKRLSVTTENEMDGAFVICPSSVTTSALVSKTVDSVAKPWHIIVVEYASVVVVTLNSLKDNCLGEISSITREFRREDYTYPGVPGQQVAVNVVELPAEWLLIITAPVTVLNWSGQTPSKKVPKVLDEG